ncbi:DNA helicase MCM9 [Asbolus verrucosus]|uniref:DNA helicase MCM9 n=1 Tax=Asbolus verrucosus TaxID=1661398 RepID=A0A482VSA1_ASBVE|nr:DNA helicase MCM9 [Asbolus verrucosus]
MCDKYLESYHKETIFEILESVDPNKHFSINIDFVELFENDPNLGNGILREPEKTLEEWDSAIKRVQTNLILQSERKLLLKNHVHCRIFGLPVCPELRRTIFPLNEDANKFLQISGTVVRMTSMKMLEYQRQYICAKCKYVMVITAEYERKNIIVSPKKCGNPEDCPGTNIINMGELNAEFCKDYQEIRMQENVSKLDVGCMPNSMWVTLEDDLVDSCKPGDNITVGIVKRRWGQFSLSKKMDIELVIKANHIQVNNNSSTTSLTPELKDMFSAFWQTYSDRPLAARDIILKSLCPQIFGLYVVKLAIAMVLAGGSHINDNSSTGVRVRAEPHLLLVGDPGTGKSQLLRFASKIIPRSVLTTGVGSTAAGLTVTAVMENGEWQLEGGALVLSDGGICCIDEFNSMKEHDRTSIHEAMEQQTISVAKASIVCKLSTRCSILAATNPKGNLDPSQPLSMNIALASPLLSRFDLILLLRDKINDNWDSLVADYILNSQNNTSKLTENIYWTIETLQAYFAVIKKVHPILTEDSNKILSGYYQAQRRKNSRNKSRTTVRLLDSLVRLSQGHARLMYHEEVQIVDAVMAVVLVETAMEADSSVFDLRFDIQNDFPESPMGNYQELVGIIFKKLQLPDLLEKELTSIEAKISNKPNPKGGSSTVTHRTESRFFHWQGHSKTEDTGGKKVKNESYNESANIQKIKTIKGNNDATPKAVNDRFSVFDDEINLNIPQNKKENELETNIRSESNNRNINTNKIKRTEEEDDVIPKRIKLKETTKDILNNLAALNCVPSVNDHFSVFDSGDIDENLDLNMCRNKKENGTEIKTDDYNQNEIDSEPLITKKIKRTKKDDVNSRKIKLKETKNDVLNDLTALNSIASLHDFLDIAEIDENLDMDTCRHQKENATVLKMNKDNKTFNTNKNNKSTSQNEVATEKDNEENKTKTTEEIPSQHLYLKKLNVLTPKFVYKMYGEMEKIPNLIHKISLRIH